MELKFKINRDTLTALDTGSLYTGNTAYYEAVFSFETDDWDSLAKTAVFTGNGTYIRALAGSSDRCLVPSEVLESEGEVWVGVYGTDGTALIISTNLVPLSVDTGAFRDGAEPETPAADVWQQYQAAINEAVSEAQESASSAGGSAEAAQAAEENASQSALQAAQDADDAAAAKDDAVTAKNAAQAALRAAQSAETAAETAGAQAQSSKTAALNASERAAASSYNASQSAAHASNQAAVARNAAENAAQAAENAAEAAQRAVSEHNVSGTAHSDIRSKIGADISAHNVSGTSHSDIRSKIGADISAHNVSDTAHADLRELIAVALRDIEIDSWADVQTIVRRGLAPLVFRIGGQFEVTRGSDTLTFDIIGFDHDTPADTDFTHSMTLQLHDAINDSLAYSSRQYAFYFPEGLAAGAHKFVWGTKVGSITTGTFQFETAEAIPGGGKIMIITGSDSYPLTDTGHCWINTYDEDDEEIENDIPIIASSGDPDIGTMTAQGVTDGINAESRVIWGSNDWKTSGIRQWLNADGAAGDWWTPQTVFDRQANASKNGFLYGMDAEFLAVLGEVTKTTQKSNSDGGGLETATEKIFLLSRPEVYGGAEVSDSPDGTVYAYYETGTEGTGVNLQRIKQKNDSATNWWLRTAVPTNGQGVRYAGYNGGINYGRANASATGGYSNSIVPACVII